MGYVGIFGGASGSKYIYSGSTVNLNHSLVKDANFVMPNFVEHESVINGDSTYTYKGDKSQFTIQVNLFKYSDPKAKLLEIYNHYQKDTEFYLYGDGNTFKNSDGETVLFHMIGFNLYYQNKYNEYDTLDITFKSNGFTNISASLA